MVSLSPSELVPTAETETALVLPLEFWWVPRTLASSLWNWVKVTLGICKSKVLVIEALLQSYSWFACTTV